MNSVKIPFKIPSNPTKISIQFHENLIKIRSNPIKPHSIPWTSPFTSQNIHFMSIKPPLHPTSTRIIDSGRDHRELLLGGLWGSHFASADGGFSGDPFWHGPLEPLGWIWKAPKKSHEWNDGNGKNIGRVMKKLLWMSRICMGIL